MKVLLNHFLKSPLKSPAKAGFTIIELLVAVVMIGILAAIAAPSWIGFTNQRRVNAANDYILRALQDAKSKAKQTKVSYSVSFRTVNEIPQIAVYPTSIADSENSNDLNDIDQVYWQVGNLGNELGLKSGQVTIGTNLGTNTDNNANQATNNVNYNLDGNNNNITNIRTITFDYLGGLPDEPEPELDTDNNQNTVEGLMITVARAKANYTEPVDSSRKCVKVVTLLGSIQVGEEDECQ